MDRLVFLYEVGLSRFSLLIPCACRCLRTAVVRATVPCAAVRLAVRRSSDKQPPVPRALCPQGKVVWEGKSEDFDTSDEPIVRQFARGDLSGAR